jgi:hypothetical protein
MKAPAAGYRIVRSLRPAKGQWEIQDRQNGDKVVWQGKTFRNARSAHYRLAVARLTGKPVSWEQARRAGNG